MSDFVPITKLEHLKVRSYFRESKHYENFDLPYYINFDNILMSASAILNGKKLSDICIKNISRKPRYPKDFSGVNDIILSNKDGGFAWRPLQLIHPILYMDLVNVITSKNAWIDIVALFDQQTESDIHCISVPLQSNVAESNRAIQVSNWWDKIEQESLRMSLDYKFIFQTDISNCYSSIYTHSLEWALYPGGRLAVKKKLANGEKIKNLGSEIDFRLQQMHQGQTIGIPQGSVLMDLIAEIVLAGTDMELTSALEKILPKNARYKILRYRDDYRIFSDEYQVGHKIMKSLNNVLYEWNMKMNITKTSESSDIISSSVKPEKLEEIYTAPVRLSYQKAAMRIYALSKKYPNAGLVAKNLTDFFDRIDRIKKPKEFDFEVVAAIITMIAYHSPKYMSQTASIVTRLIELSDNKLDRKRIISKIIEKFKDIPNTDLIDIWLQRITDADEITEYEFNSTLTKVALNREDNSYLWNSDWLNKEDKDIFNNVSISILSEELEEGAFSPIIERDEFALYADGYQQ